MKLSTVKNLIMTSLELDTLDKKWIKVQKIEQETYPKIYVEIIKGDSKVYKENYMNTPTPRRFIFQNQRPTETYRPQKEEGFIRVPPFRRYAIPKYQTIFFGLCYAYNNFGHKAMNCRANKHKQL
jgi:hypothetical protein